MTLTPPRRFALVLAFVLALAACSVPTENSATPLDPETLPEPLRPGFTAPTTTLPPNQATQIFDAYLLDRGDGERTVVRAVPRELDENATLAEVLGTLFVGATSEETEEGLVSALAGENFGLDEATVDGITAEIDIVVLDAATGEPAEEQSIEAEVLEDIAAQLVWTATSYHEAIVQVRLLVGGEPRSLPSARGDTEPGEPVSKDDYPGYDPDIIELPTTSTSSTSTTTTTTLGPG